MGKNQLFFIVFLNYFYISFTQIEKYFVVSDKIPSGYHIYMTVHNTSIVVFFCFWEVQRYILKDNILKSSLQKKRLKKKKKHNYLLFLLWEILLLYPGVIQHSYQLIDNFMKIAQIPTVQQVLCEAQKLPRQTLQTPALRNFRSSRRNNNPRSAFSTKINFLKN